MPGGTGGGAGKAGHRYSLACGFFLIHGERPSCLHSALLKSLFKNSLKISHYCQKSVNTFQLIT